MALPLSIFGDLPFPEEAWQIEEADDLVFAAQRDLTKRRYEACRLKCNAALSYANMLFETKVAAYIELAWSFDEWGSVRVARARAQYLLDDAFPAYDPMCDPENNEWLRQQRTMLHELESYERMLKDSRDRQRPAYLTLIKNQSGLGPLSGSQKKVMIVEPGAKELRESVVAELMSSPRHSVMTATPAFRKDRKPESPRGADPVLLNLGIGRLIP